MDEQNKVEKSTQSEGIFNAPWENSFKKILTPFDKFIHRETTSSLLLMATAILALILANSGLATIYEHWLHTPLGIDFNGLRLEKTLHHWVNDGLMALFFFVVGLELKREFLVGELAVPRQAVLPIVAAIGGMVVPALIYFAINSDGDAAHGWGIPMATDIAFAIGALALLGNRIPKALVTFLVALAIVDDLGAVIVIAIFYTDQIVWSALSTAAVILGLLIMLNRSGVRQPLPYLFFGSLLWFALLQSGVHATLAGVLTAFTIPARSKYDPTLFSEQSKELIARFDESHEPGKSIMVNNRLHTVVQTLQDGINKVETPLQRLEHSLHMPVAFIVIPVFAFFNAGIPINFSSIGDTLTHPVALGVILGLTLGKLLGVTGACWLALKLGVGQLPAHTRFSQIIGVSLLAGIGFTMSIFVSELGFANQPEYLLMAKTGVLIASALAGIAGFCWLRWISCDANQPTTKPT